MNRINIKNIIVVTIVFIISFSFFHYNTTKEISNEEKLISQRVEINVRTQASVIRQDLSDAEQLSEIVRYCIDANHGQLGDFGHLCSHLMEQNQAVIRISLAPKGIITQSYSSKGLSKKKTNLNKDKMYSPLLKEAIKQNSAIIAGPIQQKNKKVIVCISPIHYPVNGQRTFYGYALCTLDLSAMFKTSENALSQWNYSYKLTKTRINSTKNNKIVSSGTLKNAYTVSFQEGHCTWRLSASRQQTAVSQTTIIRMHLADFSFSLLLALGAYYLLYQQRQHKKLEQTVEMDYLTQIYNRQGFEKEAEQYLKKHPQTHCIGILIDIDDFKYINDLYGHAIGDEVLKDLSARLVRSLPEGSIVGRNGGDEFSALIPDSTRKTIEPFLKRFTSNPFELVFNSQTYRYSISIGFGEYPTQAKDLTTLLHYADAALYVVKVKGKHGCQGYEPDAHNNDRFQLGFKLQDVMTYLPGAFFIYREDDGELLYVNREMVHLMGCDDYSDFMIFTHHNFKGIIHPDDYGAALENIRKQAEASKDIIKNVRLDYRVKTKDEREILMHEVGRRVENEYFGRIWYVIMGPRPIKKKA